MAVIGDSVSFRIIVYGALAFGLGAIVGAISFVVSEITSAIPISSVDPACVKEHGMIADCEVTDRSNNLYGEDFSKAAASFEFGRMPKLRASRHNIPSPAQHALPFPAQHDLLSPARHDLPSGAHHTIPLPGSAILTKSKQELLEGTGDTAMKAIALAALQFSNSGGARASDIRMQANAAYDGLDKATKERLEALDTKMRAKIEVLMMAERMPGITYPLGFFDPVGFCSQGETMTKGKLCFYREVELKHGRVAMLASLGFLVAEQFHPLFGGNIDVPSYIAFQQTPLQNFWPAVVAAIAIPEFFSIWTFNSPFGGETWSIRKDYQPGNLGFDPLGLMPKDPKEALEMKNKELNNGRLAMIAAAGMVAQELATGEKLF